MLWVCAALSDADRAAARAAPGRPARPGRHAGRSARCGCSTSRRRLPPGLQRGRQLHAVVRAPHAVRHAEPARSSGSPSAATGTPTGPTTRRSPQALATRTPARPECPRGDPGLPPHAWPRACCRAAPRASRSRTSRTRRGRRPTTTGCCPTTIGRRGAGRHPRRRPRRLPVPALGRRVPGLLRGVLGADVDRGRAAVCYAGTSPHRRPPARRRRRRAARARRPAGRELARRAALPEVIGDRKLIVRVDRTELSKNIVRGLAAYRELLRPIPQWRGRVVHLAFAYPSRHDLPEYREYTAAVQRLAQRDRGRVRHAGLGPADAAGQRRLPALAGRPTGWPTCCW